MLEFAQTAEAIGRTPSTLEKSRLLADYLRGLQPEELRISLVSDKTDVYQELVMLCLDRSATDEALQHAERAKSRAFAERLAGSVDFVRVAASPIARTAIQAV